MTTTESRTKVVILIAAPRDHCVKEHESMTRSHDSTVNPPAAEPSRLGRNKLWTNWTDEDLNVAPPPRKVILRKDTEVLSVEKMKNGRADIEEEEKKGEKS